MRTFLDVMNSAQSVEDFKFNPLPAGEWDCVIKKIDPERKLQRDFGDVPEGTEYVEIYLSPSSPLDVDDEELNECPDWEDKLLTLSLMRAGDAAKFLDIANERGLVFDAGLDPQDYFTDEGFDQDQAFKDLTGKHVGVQVTHYQKKTGGYGENVKRTFPLE